MDKLCVSCYFKGKCTYVETCEYYFPVDPDAEDFVTDRLIETNRTAFLSEWCEYINTYDF